jgi:hypothetical protein
MHGDSIKYQSPLEDTQVSYLELIKMLNQLLGNYILMECRMMKLHFEGAPYSFCASCILKCKEFSVVHVFDTSDFQLHKCHLLACHYVHAVAL